MANETRHIQILEKEPGSMIPYRVATILFSLLEIIIGFRIIFKLLGANPANGFVNFLYVISRPFVFLFEGIFNDLSFGGETVKRVLEPGSIISLIVVAIVAWIVLSLIYPRKGNVKEQIEFFGDNPK